MSAKVAPEPVVFLSAVYQAGASQDKICNLCQKVIAAGQPILEHASTSGNHTFHDACLRSWFRTEAECPLDLLPAGIEEPPAAASGHDSVIEIPEPRSEAAMQRGQDENRELKYCAAVAGAAGMAALIVLASLNS